LKNYYQILGLKESANTDEIKNAYRLYASKFHPDKHAGDKFFEERFVEIKEAYDILSDKNKRLKYDLASGMSIDLKENSNWNNDNKPDETNIKHYDSIFVCITSEYIEDKTAKIKYLLSDIHEITFKEQFMKFAVLIGVLGVSLGIYLAEYQEDMTNAIISLFFGFICFFFKNRYLCITNKSGEMTKISITAGEENKIYDVLIRLRLKNMP